ncbi:hypothetical protein EV426DRAFT_703485 [Tirmania nivea]|nr:hypothetical protein EV426DRAFT_703485 [Tirmania nivea]
MHFPTFKTLSTVVLVSSTLAAIPMVHGALGRFSIQPRLPRDDNNMGSGNPMIPPSPQLNWRTDGPGIIKVQRGHQNPLRFTQEPTTLPDVYKRPGDIGHKNSARMEVNTAGKTPTPDTWAEGLFGKASLESAEKELLEHTINKRAEISVDGISETEFRVPYNSPFYAFYLLNQDLNVLFPISLQRALGMHEMQAAYMREAAKTLNKAAFRYLEFPDALQLDELPIELETGKKTNQDLTIVLLNMAEDDGFVEMVGRGVVDLVREEKKASAVESEVYSEVPVEEL